ncbi:MAG: site-2 protease family protein [Chlamydiota bacterium]
MIHFLYILLALLGLGVLVFIHELGHYFIARREGMKIEVFSIGLGKPLFSWMHRGVKWQICPLLFGGYVRIAGMDKEGDKEPYEISDGFYAKKPWARIKVALAGPVVNLVFAFVLFGIIWLSGGRERQFGEFTRLIGFVDPASELYQYGVRPGDELLKYNNEPFEGKQDLIYAAIFNGRDAEIKGNKIDYFDNQKTPYNYTLTPYQSSYLRAGMMSIGVLSLARYLIYQANPQEPLSPDHPMAQSGIKDGDRILWVNGQLIFSHEQLAQVINDRRVLVTFERAGETLISSVPRLLVRDLQLESKDQLNLSDWQYAAKLANKGSSLFFIPYVMTADLVIEGFTPFVDERSQLQRVAENRPGLQIGDRILAVNGQPVQNSVDFLRTVQKRTVSIIVERNSNEKPLSWKNEDRIFERDTPWEHLLPMIASIGTQKPVRQNGALYLLNPVAPIKAENFPFSSGQKAAWAERIKQQRKAIEALDSAAEREAGLEELKKQQRQRILGIALRDRAVIYNPQPVALFGSVFQEISYTLAGLIGGRISPKLLVGPVGIVQVMQQSWGDGIKEALFWLGAVSLNLGILNLLPIPVLDGGHICFSLLEAIRRKPFKAKTMRRAMIPFIALLVFFFFYVTYHDLMRLFHHFF